MATHETHKRHTKDETCARKSIRQTRKSETALADRALARLIREVNGR